MKHFSDSSCCDRQWCKGRRNFVVHVHDNHNQVHRVPSAEGKLTETTIYMYVKRLAGGDHDATTSPVCLVCVWRRVLPPGAHNRKSTWCWDRQHQHGVTRHSTELYMFNFCRRLLLFFLLFRRAGLCSTAYKINDGSMGHIGTVMGPCCPCSCSDIPYPVCSRLKQCAGRTFVEIPNILP